MGVGINQNIHPQPGAPSSSPTSHSFICPVHHSSHRQFMLLLTLSMPGCAGPGGAVVSMKCMACLHRAHSLVREQAVNREANKMMQDKYLF